jgi:hypothetical protein
MADAQPARRAHGSLVTATDEYRYKLYCADCIRFGWGAPASFELWRKVVDRGWAPAFREGNSEMVFGDT